MAFVELAAEDTPMGEISLRRRRDLTLDVDVYEVKLGDEFLMSSLFTVAERALADLGLAMLSAAASPGTAPTLDIVVGGLGLGYTAANVLADARVRSLVVVDALGEVIDWHRQGLLPRSSVLTSDARCELVHGDFFLLDWPGGDVDAVLVDIDHTPRHVLHPSHAAFYSAAGLQRVADRLRAGGVFGLWSDDPPDDEFLGVLGAVFDEVRADVVPFPNPLTGGTSANTVYLGLRR